LGGASLTDIQWTADSYSPLDLTILDHHFGTIEEWRTVIADIHRRGMYIVLDNTFGTMGDLLGFDGYLNDTTPFTLKEHKVVWKSDRRYLDFDIKNDYSDKCDYPRFWNETGYPIDKEYTDLMNGCYDSDVDQYGKLGSFCFAPQHH
jgi:alpha-1,3-glucan synthase